MIRNSTRLLFCTDPTLLFGRTLNHKVFIYNTLKTNELDHNWLKAPQNGFCRLLGLGATKTRYPLVIGTRYDAKIPFLLFSPGNGHHVKGEVYEVDDKMLFNLDVREDHPKFYVREIDEIVMLEKKSHKDVKKLFEVPPTEGHPGLIDCWVYFIRNFDGKLLDQPTFEVFSSTKNKKKKKGETKAPSIEE